MTFFKQAERVVSCETENTPKMAIIGEGVILRPYALEVVSKKNDQKGASFRLICDKLSLGSVCICHTLRLNLGKFLMFLKSIARGALLNCRKGCLERMDEK